MATEDGSAEYPVIQELQSYAHRFSFYQAVTLLEQLGAGSEHAPVGRHGPTKQEILRFRPYASLGFSAADLKRITSDSRDKQGKYLMEVTFMGLYGTVSPLPAFYTEEIISNTEGESNRRDFLDLFHHRAISLQYRILGKYLLTQHLRPGMTDQVSNWLFALIGLHNVQQLEHKPLKRLNRLLANLGLLATQNRSGAILSRIIGFYFGQVTVRVEEYVRRWVNISDDQQVRLGQTQTTLGQDMTIGHRVQDCSGKFRLWLGKLSFERYNQFLPSGEDYQELVALVRYLLQDPLSFDVGLILDKQDIPRLTLEQTNPCRLGWSSWLGHTSTKDKYTIVGRHAA